MTLSLLNYELTPFSSPDAIRAALAELRARLKDAPDDEGLRDALDELEAIQRHAKANAA